MSDHMKRKYRAYLFLHSGLLFAGMILLLLTNTAAGESPEADVVFSPRLQKAYFEIQKLRLPVARNLIDSERAGQAPNAFIPYLDSYADLHYLLISEDKAAYKIFISQEDKRLTAIGTLSDKSPYKRLFQADIRLHAAFAKLKFGNEVSGSWEIIKAYKLLEENKKKFPDFIPTLKSLGLLHVLIGSIPENYTWIAKFLGLRGNIQMGIKELRVVAKEEPFFRQEAELIDLLLHAYTLKLSPEQQRRLRQWPGEQPDNLLLHFFATTVLIKENKSEEAGQFLASAPNGPAYMPFPFLHYLRGEIAIQKGRYDDAFHFYTLFLRQYAGFNYIKDSNFKLMMCRWLADRDQEANAFAKKVTATGNTIVEADQFAENMATAFLAGNMKPQQKHLFKARYATDGGYLGKATEIMSAISEDTFNSTDDKAEYNYRKGRILQKSAQNAASIAFYDRALTLSQKEATAAGFGASSALQLGYIFMERRDDQKAAFYFRKALSFKRHEYKNSIDNKARAALTELGQ